MKRIMTILAAALSLTLALGAQEIPAYFLENNYLQERLRQVPKGKHFLFITDYHQERSSHTSTAVMSYVKKQMGIDRVVFGGDCFDWAPDKAAAAQKLGRYFDELYAAFGEGLIWVQGNHDCNSSAVSKYKIPEDVALIPDVQCYDLTIGHFKSERTYDEDMLARYRDKADLSDDERAGALAWIKMHYWVDDPALKIRFIVIETDDRGVTARHIIRGRELVLEQMPFLEKALETAPKGYTPIVFSHQLGNNKQGLLKTSAHTPVINTVAKFRAKTGRRAFLVSGHCHVDEAMLIHSGENIWDVQECVAGGKIGKDGVLLVWCNRDAYKAGSTRYAAGGPGVLLKQSLNPRAKLGTPTEVSFDIVTLTRKGVVFTRIGAGEPQRIFTW
ncbi:MAG: metallophosphoesterase [Bacteroidales bacterium]|nr:metallophosphoesterase [Bacteroidales bacterium]